VSLISIERVLALAPDASAAQAGRGQASRSKWQSLGTDGQALWGLCQGSGKNPYQVRVALADLTGQCSCPSRKLPCKHVLGALLLLAAGEVAQGEPPAFVVEWLDKRNARAEKSVERAQAKRPGPADPESAREAAKREERRDARMEAGIAELKGFVEDLVAGGFAHAEVREPKFWDARARRLVDAQLPGLARQVGELAGTALGARDWPERLLAKLSLIYLAACAYERRETLAAPQQADLMRVFGVAQRQVGLADGDVVEDLWCVLGERREEIDHLRALRTWLYGWHSQRFALLLAFAPPGQPLTNGLVQGANVALTLGFFEGSEPLRAAPIEGQMVAPDAVVAAPPGATVSAALDRIAAARCRDPWLHPLPVLVGATLRRDALDDWWLVDASGDALAFQAPREGAWPWLAASGGRACVWFGEWHGTGMVPLAVWDGARA
jgi:hypothetical protein